MRMKTLATLAALTAAGAVHASLPPNGGLETGPLSEKEYLDQIGPDQLSNLIDILNDGAATASR